MLGNEELLAWFQRVRLPECGRSIVHQVRSSDPARRVGGGYQNVSGRYPSKKMGVTIQFESHRVELARIYELEHDTARYLASGEGDVKRLQDIEPPELRLRVGDYRVRFYDYGDSILVLAVKHRREAYR